MVFRPARGEPAGRFLVARGTLLVFGGGCALVGMLIHSRPVVWVAIGVLLLAFLLRFAGPSPRSPDSDSD